MDTAVYWIGWATIGLGCVAVVWGICLTVKDVIDSRRDRVINEGREWGRRQIAQDAYWFSEDTPTFNAIKRLGEGQGVSSVREQWRHERASAAARPPEAAGGATS